MWESVGRNYFLAKVGDHSTQAKTSIAHSVLWRKCLFSCHESISICNFVHAYFIGDILHIWVYLDIPSLILTSVETRIKNLYIESGNTWTAYVDVWVSTHIRLQSITTSMRCWNAIEFNWIAFWNCFEIFSQFRRQFFLCRSKIHWIIFLTISQILMKIFTKIDRMIFLKWRHSIGLPNTRHLTTLLVQFPPISIKFKLISNKLLNIQNTSIYLVNWNYEK